MKKIVFTANSMIFGGIEKSLINILKQIDYEKYDVTLILQECTGIYLSDIPKQVHIIEYKINNSKNIIYRKVVNRIKMIKTCIKYKNKFDFSACFATYSIPGAILARNLSKNNAIWMHNDYYYVYNKEKNKIDEFMNGIGVDKFKRIIFVANESKEHFIEIYGNLKDKCDVCNNLIDYKKVLELGKEEITEKKTKKILLNVSRHDEGQKKLTRLINVAKKLKEDKYDFEIWMVGNGPDTNKYEELIKKYKLEDYVKLLGSKKNPYPYYKIADAFIMTSDYEGFPVVYVESCMFNLPIITTIDVTDDYIDVKKNYGILVEKNEHSIYDGIKKFLDNGYKIKKEFDPKQYNKIISNKINNYIENK